MHIKFKVCFILLWCGLLGASSLIAGASAADGVALKEAVEKQPALSAAQAIAPDCAREGRRLQRQPASAFGGGMYLVAWSDGSRQLDAETADIYCARVDAASGKPLDPAGILVCSAQDLQEWPSVAFDGENFLVAWQDFRSGKNYDVYAARVSKQGKVLDPDGFAVSAGPANEARPALAFAAGQFVVAWMDAREYPIYGLYAARISTAGKILDAQGQAIDTDPIDKIKKAMPPEKSWLGDKHYWWRGLYSRLCPTIATDGKTCLVTYIRENHSNESHPYGLLLDPATLSVTKGPQRFWGELRDRPSACALENGWCVAFDQWMSGWDLSPRLAALRLTADMTPEYEVLMHENGYSKKTKLQNAPLLNIQKSLDSGERTDSYPQGKGHAAFWQSACVNLGGQPLVVAEHGWRPTKEKYAGLKYVIIAARVSPDGSKYVDVPPMIVAEGASGEAGNLGGTTVSNPTAVAGPAGQAMIAYEHDAGVDKATIQFRIVGGK